MKNEKNKKAKEYLKEYIKPSSRIGITIESVSRSGMTRRMKVYTKDFQNITHLISDLIGWSMNEKGILVSGCGMDMCFHLADTITMAMNWHNYDKGKEYTAKGLKGNGGNCIDWAVL